MASADQAPENAAGPPLPPQQWFPRFQIAFLLCHAREPGHHDEDYDYCNDCLDQADRILDDSAVTNALWCALMDVEQDDYLEANRG